MNSTAVLSFETEGYLWDGTLATRPGSASCSINKSRISFRNWINEIGKKEARTDFERIFALRNVFLTVIHCKSSGTEIKRTRFLGDYEV